MNYANWYISFNNRSPRSDAQPQRETLECWSILVMNTVWTQHRKVTLSWRCGILGIPAPLPSLRRLLWRTRRLRLLVCRLRRLRRLIMGGLGFELVELMLEWVEQEDRLKLSCLWGTIGNMFLSDCVLVTMGGWLFHRVSGATSARSGNVWRRYLLMVLDMQLGREAALSWIIEISLEQGRWSMVMFWKKDPPSCCCCSYSILKEVDGVSCWRKSGRKLWAAL